MKPEAKSFIVRIWNEAAPEEVNQPRWRGVIEQVGSAKRLYFHEFEKAMEFIREQAGLQPDTPLSGWQMLQNWISNGLRKRNTKRE